MISYNDYINENNDESLNKIEKVHKTILNEYGLQIYYLATFNTSILVLYPVINELITNMKLSFELNIYQVCLLTIFAVSEILRINADKLTKMKETLIDQGIFSLVKEVKKSLLSIKKIISIVSHTMGGVIKFFSNMLAYVSIMVPVNKILLDLFENYSITPDSLYQLVFGSVAAMGVLTLKNLIIYIIKKLNKSKVKESQSYIYYQDFLEIGNNVIILPNNEYEYEIYKILDIDKNNLILYNENNQIEISTKKVILI